MPDFDRTSWARETSVYWLKDPARSNVCHDANYDTMAAWEVESE